MKQYHESLTIRFITRRDFMNWNNLFPEYQDKTSKMESHGDRVEITYENPPLVIMASLLYFDPTADFTITEYGED